MPPFQRRSSTTFFTQWALALCLFLPGIARADSALERADAALAWGNYAAGIVELTTAAGEFQRQGETTKQVRALIRLAEARTELGQWDLSEASLKGALALAERSSDSEGALLARGALGGLYVQLRRPELADGYLDQSLVEARKTENKAQAARILNDLGSLRVLQERPEDAAAAYKESEELARTAGDWELVARVALNAANSSSGDEDKTFARSKLDSAETILAPSQPLLREGPIIGKLFKRRITQGPAGVQLLVVAASLRIKLAELEPNGPDLPRAKSDAIAAVLRANTLGNDRLRSLAIGTQGAVAEKQMQWEEALRLTRQARFLAQQANAAHLLYRWEWQAGRILKAQGELDEAIGCYRRAVATYRSLLDCAGVLALSSYEETARPLYYELADLLLQRSSKAAGPVEVKALLTEARDTVELLKTAELSDYFQDACVASGKAKVKEIGTVLNRAAVVYYVTLPDRTEILLETTAGLQRFTVSATAGSLRSRARRMRIQLQRGGSDAYLPYSQELYDLLLRPLEETLREEQVDTLVFVLDSSLRTIPMAALNDGNQFLIEKYSLAVAPALTLMDPQQLAHRQVRIFAGGLSEAVQGYAALASVPRELNAIKADYPTTALLNQQFDSANFKREVSTGDFSVVHIASHGQFGSKAASTYLLTYDGKISLDELEKMIRPRQYRGTPVELLFLSACQTAAGDDKAALGLAGIAVKAGARSALASLWSVSDEATAALVADFYGELKKNPGISRAAALRHAQLELLKDERFRHPSFWAPYLVIGDWS